MVDQSVYFGSVAAQTTSLLHLDPNDQLRGHRELPAGEDEGGGETQGGDHQHWAVWQQVNIYYLLDNCKPFT